MPTFSGIRPTDRVPAGAKLRVTWGRDWFARNSFFPPSAVAAARKIQEIAGRGYFVVSPLAVSPGDQTFVLDVKTQTTWQGTAATLAQQLEAASGFDVTVVKLVPAGESSDAAAKDRAELQAGAEEKADESGLAALANVPGAIGRELRRVVTIAAVAGVVLLVVTNLGAIQAVGRAVKRAAK